ALELAEACGYPFEIARIRLERGRPDDLAAARGIFTRLGARPYLEQIRTMEAGRAEKSPGNAVYVPGAMSSLPPGEGGGACPALGYLEAVNGVAAADADDVHLAGDTDADTAVHGPPFIAARQHNAVVALAHLHYVDGIAQAFKFSSIFRNQGVHRPFELEGTLPAYAHSFD